MQAALVIANRPRQTIESIDSEGRRYETNETSTPHAEEGGSRPWPAYLRSGTDELGR